MLDFFGAQNLVAQIERDESGLGLQDGMGEDDVGCLWVDLVRVSVCADVCRCDLLT